jgi:hypothetical protein
MNKVCKVMLNRVRNVFVTVSERAPSFKKTKSAAALSAALLSFAGLSSVVAADLSAYTDCFTGTEYETGPSLIPSSNDTESAVSDVIGLQINDNNSEFDGPYTPIRIRSGASVTVSGTAHITNFTVGDDAVLIKANAGSSDNPNTLTFAGDGVTLTAVSSYGAMGIVYYGSEENAVSTITFQNSGDVEMNLIVPGDPEVFSDSAVPGVAVANVIGIQGNGQILTVADTVGTFAVNTYGSGIFTGDALYSNGTVAVRAVGDTETFNSEKLTVHAVAGQSYAAPYRLTPDSEVKTVNVAFDAEAAKALGTDYSVTHGIYNQGRITAGEATELEVTVSDGFWNAVGIRNDPLYIDADSDTIYAAYQDAASFAAAGNVTVDVEGANAGGDSTEYTGTPFFTRLTGTYGVLAETTEAYDTDSGGNLIRTRDGAPESRVVLGSAGKTVTVSVREFRDSAGSYAESTDSGDSAYNLPFTGVYASYAAVDLSGAQNSVSVSSRSSAYGVKAADSGTVTLGADSAAANSVSAESLFHEAAAVTAEGSGQVTINGAASISAAGAERAAGVAVNGESAAVTINGDAVITAQSDSGTARAVEVLSGSFTLHGNADISAAAAVYAESGTVSVNTGAADSAYSTKITGDIALGSGAPKVAVALSGSESSLTGAVTKADASGTAEITLSKGAVWNVTGASSADTVTLSEGGTVAAKGADLQIGKLSVSGEGNKLTADGADIAVESIALADGAALTVPFATAFTAETKDGIVTGAAERLTVEGSDTSSLTVEEPVTYSVRGLNALAAAYPDIAFEITGGTLSPTEEDAGVPLSIPENAAVTLTAADGADIAAGSPLKVAGTVTVDAGEAGSTAKLSSAEIAEGGTLAVNARVAAENIAVSKGAALLAGSDEAAGHLTVENLSLKGTLFLDPAWQNGAEATTAAVKLAGSTLEGTLAVGRNSKMVIGSTDTAPLDSALSALGRSVSETDLLAASYVAKAVTLAAGAALTVDGTMTEAPAAAAPGVTVAKGSALILNADEGLNGAIITSDGGTFSVSGDLYLDNAKAGETVTVAAGFDSVAVESTPKALSRLITLTPAESGSGSYVLTASANTALADKTVTPALLAAAASASGSGADRIAALFDASAGLTADEAAAGMNRIALMGTASAAQTAALNTAGMIADSLERHGALFTADRSRKGPDLWIDLNGSFSRASSYQAGSTNYGYKSDIAGVTVGSGYAFGGGAALGAAASFGAGAARGRGAGAGVKNQIRYFALNLYGAWNTPWVTLTGEAGYTESTNKIQSMGCEGKPHVKTVSAALRAEKTFAAGKYLSVTPHAGVRFASVGMDSFTAGGFTYSAKRANIAQIPVGVAFASDYTVADGSSVKPFADLTASTALGSGKSRRTVRLAGTDASDSFSARITAGALWQAKIGLEASRGSHSLSVSYGAAAGAHDRLDQSLAARYRYSF